eukprot:jgi/Bigna1/131001/aug1.13_g5709
MIHSPAVNVSLGILENGSYPPDPYIPSLVQAHHKFVDERFDHKIKPTNGLAARAKFIEVDKVIIKLHIYDFSSAIRHRRMVQEKLSSLDGVVICSTSDESKKSLNDIRDWMALVDGHARKNCFRTLLRCKVDDASTSVSDDFETWCLDENDCWLTSAKTGTNVSRFFELTRSRRGSKIENAANDTNLNPERNSSKLIQKHGKKADCNIVISTQKWRQSKSQQQKWKVGSIVEVYSRSQQKWFPSTIRKISKDEIGITKLHTTIKTVSRENMAHIRPCPGHRKKLFMRRLKIKDMAVVERVRDDGTVDLDVKKQVDYRDLQRLRRQISESRSEINELRKELEILRSERTDILRMRIGKTGSSSETLLDKESMSTKATSATKGSSTDSKGFHLNIHRDLALLLNELKHYSRLSSLSESLRDMRKIIEGIVDFYQRGVSESENLKREKMNEFRIGLIKLKNEIVALQCAEENFPIVSVGIACIVGFRMNIVNFLFAFSLALVVRWVCSDWINRLWEDEQMSNLLRMWNKDELISKTESALNDIEDS